MSKAPITVCVTGGGGQIAYSLLPSLVNGSVFGPDQPVILHLLDIPPAMAMLDGVRMELEDLAYPLYVKALCTADANAAFAGADYVVFLGSFPRKEGMERKDVMEKNVGIFAAQGKALAGAKPSVKCLVVGNPANTNAAILSLNAPAVPRSNISALTRLDHNRARSMLAIKSGLTVTDVDGVIIWGNHSSTQYPDVRHATVGGKQALSKLPQDWLEGEFLTSVQKRGAAVIAARKLSSAASAAKAICDHLRDWASGTGDKFVSMAVDSTGNSYGVPDGLFYSFPVKCADGKWTIVDGLPVDAFSRGKMDATAAELVEELALAKSLVQ
jgi:malate dehydrogenase